MKNTVRNTLMGAVATLAMTGANAANIFVTPASTTVDFTNPFTLTVQGSGFANGILGGGVELTWQTAQLDLVTSKTDFELGAGLSPGWFNVKYDLNVDSGTGLTSLALDQGALSESAVLGSAEALFNLISIEFRAIAPASVTNLAIGISPLGVWLDGIDSTKIYEPGTVTYTGAEVTSVPLPAAVWLFGTGLLGLAGVARRRNPAEA